MTDVSGALRAERERAGLTIAEISARTKIKVTQLQAIERGEFEQLPGEFFTRAFLRTYARELHLSPDEIVSAYDARFCASDHDGQAGPRTRRAVDDAPGPALGSLKLPSSRSVWPTIAVAGAILVVLSLMNRSTPDNPSQPQPVGTSGVADAAEPVVAAASPRAVPEKLTIEIEPSRVMWVAGMADGKRVIYRLVEPGERVRIDAQQEFWFRVGDAGAFVYSINGSPAKPLGGAGEVREFTITRENSRVLTR